MKKKSKEQKPSTASKPIPSSKADTPSTDDRSTWIPIKGRFELPEHIRGALQRLDESGHVAYVVGGCVRDFLLGRAPKDHDIATTATPDELMRIFPDAIPVGKEFGVIRLPYVKASGENGTFEVATFRTDLEYKNHRHPVGVKFAGPEEDALRRDFTINALFYDAKSQRVLDSVGGQKDLDARIVRAIGDPQKRFQEDALRLLRAVRFATTLDFKIEDLTAKSISTRGHLIRKISPERIRDELDGMLLGPRPDKAMELLSELGLLSHILPEVEAEKGVRQSPIVHSEGDVWTHTIKVLRILARERPVRTRAMAWGALLHDIGKPVAARKSGGKNFNGHERDGATMARQVCDRLRLPRAETEVVEALVLDLLKFNSVFQMREATLQRWVRQPYFGELLDLHHAVALAWDGNLAYYDFCKTRLDEIRSQSAADANRHKLIDGNDLIQLGLSPGPKFTQIISAVEDLALENKIRTKEEALEFVVKHFVD